MIPISWSPQALRDLESIRDYVARDSVAYADLLVRRIVACVDRLAAFPDSGRVVPERGDPQVREVIAAPFRIVYRRLPEEVEVVTVFRASRLLPDLG